VTYKVKFISTSYVSPTSYNATTIKNYINIYMYFTDYRGTLPLPESLIQSTENLYFYISVN
jgi:hypothetical protein